MPDSLIVEVIHRYHPEWEAPTNTGRTWLPCLCPFHGDTVKSAAVSYDYDSFRCLACDVGGTAVGIIKQQEGGDYATAIRIAKTLTEGGYGTVSGIYARQPRGRVSWDEGTDFAFGGEGSREVPTGIRGRPNPWT